MNNIEVSIHLDKFSPRTYQEPIMDAIFNKGYRKVLAVLPRRAGKDITGWNCAIRQCLMKVCLVYYVLPEYGQCRRAIFDAITIDGMRFLDYIPKQVIASINTQQMKITFINGSILQCLGGDTHNSSIRGTNPYAIILSEYAYMSGDVLDTISPILAVNGGWLLIVSTPFGKNHQWHLHMMARELKDWFVLYKKTSEINHVPYEALQAEKARMSHEKYLQEYECFPGTTGVLTPNGVVAIRDIKIGDLVISHSGRPRRVTDVMRKYHEGNLMKIKSCGSSEDILCTVEHPLRVYNRNNQSYEWKMAWTINRNDMLVFPKMNIGQIKIISQELCLLMAWYITEGSCGKNYVQFSLKDDKEAEVVGDLLRKLDYEYNKFESTGTQVVVNSCQLLDFLKINCGSRAENKRIPFSLISGYEELFFYELIKGDGCFNTQNGYSKYIYTTISKSLAYQFQMLAHSIPGDFAAGICVRDGGEDVIMGRMVTVQKSYVVSINIQKNKFNDSPWMVRAKNCVAAKITQEVQTVLFNDYVYNLSVQHDESYIVDGRAVHNCSYERGVEGTYYGRELEKLRQRGQITSVSWEPGLLVYVAIDIGVSDATTMIFWQSAGDNTVLRIIDCYSNNGVGLDHYVKDLAG